VLETLTGVGLATSAGLNAYIPLIILGLLGRYTDMVNLPPQWAWLQNGWTIGIIAALLLVEFIADKIPVVDHLNDVVQTVIRPTSGGLAFGAATTSQTVTVSDPGAFFSSNQWVPILAGMVISFIVHGIKAAARPVVNASTAGFGAPVASTAEDIVSVFLSFVAILLPVLIIVFMGLFIWGATAILRRRRRRKEEKLAQREAERLAREAAHDGHTLDLWRQTRGR